MKKLTTIRLSIFIVVLAVLMIALALPGDHAMASDDEQNPKVRFTIINYSQHPVSVSANGPEYFNLEVGPDSKGYVLVPRGVYKFNLEACNHTSSGVLNLTI